MKKLLIVDGYSVLSKVYYATPLCMHKEGKHTNAVQGFLHVLQEELVSEEIDAVYAVFGSQDGLASELFQAEYLQQKQCPDGLTEQIAYAVDMMKILKIPVLQDEHTHRRDLLYHLIQDAGKINAQVRILTADSEMLRFVSEGVEVCLVQLQEKATRWITYHEDTMLEKYRIEPSKWHLVLALSSHAKETGIGQAGALELASKYENLEDIYQHIDDINSSYFRKNLETYRKELEEAYRLLTIQPGAEYEFEVEKAMQYQLTQETVEMVYQSFGGMSASDEKAEEREVKLVKKKVNASYHIEKVKNVNQADSIWHACMEKGLTALQVFSMEGREETQMLSSASGQMYLQFGENAKQNMLAAAIINSKYPDTVFWMSTDETLTEAYLREKLSEYILHGQSTFATFDIKSEYADMLPDRTEFSLDRTERIFDSKIAAYLLNPLKSDYQIQDIAKEYLEIEMSGWQDLFGKADKRNAYQEKKEQVIDYFARMAWVSYQANGLLEAKLSTEGMNRLFREVEMPLTYVLYDMEREGIMIKPEALKQYGDRLQVRISELEQIIYQEAGTVFNINSPKQLGEVLFERLGLPGGKKTKTGYSTAADVLEKLSEEYPIVNDILEYRQLAKLKSTYADGLANYIAEDNRIHTSFNQTITATGRLSSTEPNLQNIPMRMELGRLIRKVFVPKEGCVFMDADYSQIELRILAHMSEDENLIEAYQMSEDIHRITASQVFHTPLDEVTDLQRRNAKAVNFGIVYGISSFGLSQGLSITRKEASEYIERYFETYPGVKEFLDRLVSEAKLTGKSKSMFGRIRPIPELQSSNYVQRQFGERVAMNAPIQGTAADIIKIAMVSVWKGLQEAGLRSKLILQIHDELLIETAEDEVEQVKEIMSCKMQEAAKLSVALDIELHTGQDWYEAK